MIFQLKKSVSSDRRFSVQKKKRVRCKHSLMMPSQYSFLVAPIVHLFYLRHNTLPSISRASALPLCAYGAAALSEVTGNGNASLNVPKPVIGYSLHRSLQYLLLRPLLMVPKYAEPESIPFLKCIPRNILSRFRQSATVMVLSRKVKQ